MTPDTIETINSTATLPLRVLVVDDDELNQRMMRVILNRDGYQVVTASNGAEAVEMVKNQGFDVVLMDLQMPVMSGIEASRKIREWENGKKKHTFIVALTASFMPEKGKDLFEAGVDNYISKPFDLDHLRQILQYSYENRGVIANPSLDASESFPEFDPTLGLGRVGGDDETYRELLEDFMRDLPKKQELLRKCLIENDLDALFRTAHNLKGVSANLGLLRLSEYARKIEKQEKTFNLDVIRDILVDMDGAVRKLDRSVAEFLSEK